jgi:hypothetical protein
MAFPVFATVKDCFTRIPRDWHIIWRYLQVPFLLCCLFGCVMLGIYVLAGSEKFITTETIENQEKLVETGWYPAFFLAISFAPYLIFTPFAISWGRYTLIGERGLEGRQSWSWGKPEWHFIKGGIVFLLVILGWGVAFALATGIPAVLGFMLVAAFGLKGPVATVLAVVAGAIYFAALVVFLSYMTRLYVVFIPLAFAAPFTSESLWAVTKGKVWRYLGGLIMIGVCIGIPFWVVTFATSSAIFDDDPTGPLKMQLLQGIFLFPFTAISLIATTAYYAEVWRFSGGHEEWSGTAAPAQPPSAETTTSS